MNVTGTEGRKFSDEELDALSREAVDRKAPSWVSAALQRQIEGVSE